jgi:hypothetical protein
MAAIDATALPSEQLELALDTLLTWVGGWVGACRQSAVHQVLSEVKIKIKQYKAEMAS